MKLTSQAHIGRKTVKLSLIASRPNSGRLSSHHTHPAKTTTNIFKFQNNHSPQVAFWAKHLFALFALSVNGDYDVVILGRLPVLVLCMLQIPLPPPFPQSRMISLITKPLFGRDRPSGQVRPFPGLVWCDSIMGDHPTCLLALCLFLVQGWPIHPNFPLQFVLYVFLRHCYRTSLNMVRRVDSPTIAFGHMHENRT